MGYSAADGLDLYPKQPVLVLAFTAYRPRALTVLWQPQAHHASYLIHDVLLRCGGYREMSSPHSDPVLPWQSRKSSTQCSIVHRIPRSSSGPCSKGLIVQDTLNNGPHTQHAIQHAIEHVFVYLHKCTSNSLYNTRTGSET